jgi:hypothetical protein
MGWGGQAVLSRLQCALLLLCCLALVGCGGVGGDFLWWPSFHYYPTAYTNAVPVHDVALEVQCEIYRFLDNENGPNEKASKGSELLDPSKGAGVVLILQTDLSGSVQYVGINLSKLGFTSLAELVTATNKVPSLQAKANGQATISAEVDFTVAQSRTAPPAKETIPPNIALKKSDFDKSTIYENVEFKDVDPKHPNGEFHAKPTLAAQQSPFPQANCGKAPFYRAYLELWLDDWLSRYKPYREDSLQKGEPFVCGTKVTLKSMFKVLYDVSAGVNAFAAPPIILPISGFNVDASPDYSHSIAISFALQDPKHFPGDRPGGQNHQNYCSALGAGTQPAVK